MTVRVDKHGQLKTVETEFRFDPASLGDRAARQRLPRRESAYWVPLGSAGTYQTFLGYCNRLPEGEWVVRWIDGSGNSNWSTLAPADDHGTKGGVPLSKVKPRAEEWIRAQLRKRQ